MAILLKELYLSLRHALERHEVPAAVSAHVDYCGLDGPAALAKYAFNLGTTRPDPFTVVACDGRPTPYGHIHDMADVLRLWHAFFS